MHTGRQRVRAVLYARISTNEKRQNYRLQLQELRQVARQRGWQVVGEFHDCASGRTEKRPGLAEAMKVCRAGGADIFAAITVDRVARSAVHFFRFLGDLESLRVRLACVRDGDLDTTTPTGEAITQMRAIFAQLEAKLTGQRIREVLALKRAGGQTLGAPRRLAYEHLPAVIRARSRKKDPPTWRTIAARFGGSAGGWQRAVERARAA